MQSSRQIIPSGATPRDRAADLRRLRARRAPFLGFLDRTFAEGTRAEAGAVRDARFRRALGVADIAAVATAIVAGLWVFGDPLSPISLVLAPVTVLVAKNLRLYDRDEFRIHKTTLDEAPQLAQLTAIVVAVAWFTHALDVWGAREKVAVLLLAILALLIAFRATARALVRRLSSPERCLLMGDESALDSLGRKLSETPGIKAAVVGSVALTAEDGTRGTDYQVSRLRKLVELQAIERVIFAPRVADSQVMLDVVREMKGAGVKVSVLPRIFEVIGSSVEFDEVVGLRVLGVRRFGLSRSSLFVKRLLDVVGGAAMLVAVAPLMLLLALAIRLESRGPVFFRQERVGRDGRRFRILKFRSMVADAEERRTELLEANEAEGLFKISDDPRITRVGHLLRLTSLDELPQLVNVLRGDMSLVGPRPLVLEEDQRVGGWHRRRLHLKPGMTGHWQILGSSRIPLREMVNIDYLYVANWSLWADVKILLRTVPYMLARRGM